MRRLFNFTMGFLIGFLLSATIVLLATPHSAQTIQTLFKEAYHKRKKDLEVALDLETKNE